MSPVIDAYLALRRSAGFALSNEEYLLRSFARFAAERGEGYIRAATAIAWASEARSLAQRDARLKSICRLADFVRLEDPTHERPPVRHFAHPRVRRVPYELSRYAADPIARRHWQPAGGSGSPMPPS
jgi:hypothetical protein